MKNFRFHILLISFLVLGGAFSIQAQNTQASRKYRVVAYKNGNPSVTSTSNITEVVPYMSIFIPNSFTPNGDGLNDTFGPYGEAIIDFNMQVFNRWGQVIFESNNTSTRWDGTHDGVKVPEGSYVYRITAKGMTGKPEHKDGAVHIVY